LLPISADKNAETSSGTRVMFERERNPLWLPDRHVLGNALAQRADKLVGPRDAPRTTHLQERTAQCATEFSAAWAAAANYRASG
jgi:hypothetical protein